MVRGLCVAFSLSRASVLALGNKGEVGRVGGVPSKLPVPKGHNVLKLVYTHLPGP